MFSAVPTKEPAAVQAEVERIYTSMFPSGERLFVKRAFDWVVRSFAGQFKDYQPIDARYHDLEHTLQGTLCLARVLKARQAAGATPSISQRTFELALLAILLHDTGYLKKRDDREGTGAKYTLTHVHRSADFAAELLQEKDFPPEEIHAIQNMICCTGVDAKLDEIPFQNQEERVAGYALGTADLLGQMAADDYVQKLPVLFSEFAEAIEFSHDGSSFIGTFSNAEDLMRKTPVFWEKFVLPKLQRDFAGLYIFLNEPYPSGPNEYLQRIEQNMRRIHEALETKVA